MVTETHRQRKARLKRIKRPRHNSRKRRKLRYAETRKELAARILEGMG